MAKRRTDTAGAERAAARKRNFATVIYPESAPADWRQRLNDQHVPALVSPLHDQDTDEGSGKKKKPHYHVLLMFETPKDFETDIKPIFDEIGGVGRENVKSKRGYARYLCHLDNPEKAQYDKSLVAAYGGADYSAVVHLPSDDVQMVRDIMDFVRVNGLYSFAEVLDVCAKVNEDWFNLLITSRGYIVREYVKSLLWERDAEHERVKSVVMPSGEVVEVAKE